jgi:hypothetical protein
MEFDVNNHGYWRILDETYGSQGYGWHPRLSITVTLPFFNQIHNASKAWQETMIKERALVWTTPMSMLAH